MTLAETSGDRIEFHELIYDLNGKSEWNGNCEEKSDQKKQHESVMEET